MKGLAPYVIEGHNQTTQAPFCAAYLSILATKYGGFIPALSEHHTGGANVGRTLINGERLGPRTIFLGRRVRPRSACRVSRCIQRSVRHARSRSFLYAEMVFGNAPTVTHLIATTPQSKIFAMRTTRSLTITDISRRLGLSADTFVDSTRPCCRVSRPGRICTCLGSSQRSVATWRSGIVQPALRTYPS